jgi:hypothetical protein
MTATHVIDSNTTSSPVLYLAFELGWNSWKLVITTGAAQKPRIRTIAARDIGAVTTEIGDAKRRFRLAPIGELRAPMVGCWVSKPAPAPYR